MYYPVTVSEGIMLDVVTETVIGNFLPDRTKTELIADALYRVKASNESFHDFVQVFKGS